MNAVARATFINNPFAKSIPFKFDLPELKIMVLLFSLLVSALGIVYIKDLNRRLFIVQHQLQLETERLQIYSNKLLLEQSAWGAQARVQMVAQQQLQMQIPPSANVIMIKV